MANVGLLIAIFISYIILLIGALIILLLVIHKKSQEKTSSEKIADSLEASNSSPTMKEFTDFIKNYKPVSYSINGDFHE